MKITEIAVNQKRAGAVNGSFVNDYCLYLFRKPVIFGTGENERRYGGSTAILFGKGERQYFRGYAGKGFKYDMISFRMSSADENYIADMNIPLNEPVMIPDDFIISSAIRSMKIYDDSSERRKQEFFELSVRVIFIALEDANGGGQRENIVQYPMIKELRNDVYNSPALKWSVDSVCRKMMISRTYFHRIYGETFGTTFMQDVIESRLMYATELLENTDLSVSVIAEKCGYESESYFMRQFRKRRGCTPTEYRKKKFSGEGAGEK